MVNIRVLLANLLGAASESFSPLNVSSRIEFTLNRDAVIRGIYVLIVLENPPSTCIYFTDGVNGNGQLATYTKSGKDECQWDEEKPGAGIQSNSHKFTDSISHS